MRDARRAKRGWRSGCSPALALASFALLVCASGCGDPVPRARRIVLVTIDTLRADRVGAYGDEQALTPTLDQLASLGTRFAWAIAPTPTTLPSHTSLMTGLDPSQHGARANGRFSLGEEVTTVAENMKAAGLATAAFVSAVVLDARYGLDQGFDVYDDEIGSTRSSKGVLAVAERKGPVVVDAALEWVREAPEDFFLWVHLYDPHGAYEPPAGWAGRVGGDSYRGEIAFADSQVLRLIEGLHRRFGPEDLLVAVTSDHGESLGEHDELTHSHTLYDATQHVPMLLVGPSIPRNRVVEAPVRLIDLGPTLLARAGAAPLPGARGVDLLPVIFGEPGPPEGAYLETLDTQLGMGWSPLLGLRTERHKYIRAPVPELYDLAEDPQELSNLALERPDLVAGLDARLATLLAAESHRAEAPQLDEAERQQLLALGYLGAGNGSGEARPLGVVGGPNPRDHQHEVEILLRASTVIGQGRGATGLRMLATMRSRDGELYHQLRALAALQIQDADIAREAGDRLFTLGNKQEGLYYRAMGAVIAGDFDSARRDLDESLRLHPENSGVLVALGQIAERDGSLEEAGEYYQRAAREDPTAPSPAAHLAALRLSEGRIEESDQILRAFGPAVAEHSQSILRLVAAEEQAGRAGMARFWLEAGVKAKPHHPALLALLATTQERAGQLDEAVQTRRRLRQIDPGSPLRDSDLAWALAGAGTELDRALELAEQGAAARPVPATYATLATVRLARGEPAEALAAADHGLRDSPPSVRPQLLFVRASALAELGRTGEARAALTALSGEDQPLEPPWAERAEALATRIR